MEPTITGPLFYSIRHALKAADEALRNSKPAYLPETHKAHEDAKLQVSDTLKSVDVIASAAPLLAFNSPVAVVSCRAVKPGSLYCVAVGEKVASQDEDGDLLITGRVSAAMIRNLETVKAELPGYDRSEEERYALRSLAYAARGGNADMSTPDALRWCADRFVKHYGENPGTDYVRALRERASMIEGGLKLVELLSVPNRAGPPSPGSALFRGGIATETVVGMGTPAADLLARQVEEIRAATAANPTDNMVEQLRAAHKAERAFAGVPDQGGDFTGHDGFTTGPAKPEPTSTLVGNKVAFRGGLAPSGWSFGAAHKLKHDPLFDSSLTTLLEDQGSEFFTPVEVFPILIGDPVYALMEPIGEDGSEVRTFPSLEAARIWIEERHADGRRLELIRQQDATSRIRSMLDNGQIVGDELARDLETLLGLVEAAEAPCSSDWPQAGDEGIG